MNKTLIYLSEKFGSESVKILFCKIYGRKMIKDLFKVNERESTNKTTNKFKLQLYEIF